MRYITSRWLVASVAIYCGSRSKIEAMVG